VPSYNNKDWYQKNLDSIFMQDYDNFDVIYIDDRSPDGTGNLVEKYIQEKGKNNVRLIKNTERCLALKNIYTGVHMCQDDDIVALLDGDDWYAHPHVLSLINDIYQDSQVWLTYGQLAHYPDNTKQTCQPYPEQDNAEYDFRMSHSFPVAPRTFYAGLFWHIDKRDLMYRGKFFEMTSDPAIMLPMLEMARNNHFRFIPIVLYFCNDAPGVVHDRTTNGKLQLQLHNFINGLPSYDAIADYHQDGPLIPD
jgi:glycosyltransferase involved in cell wall biosynthesis